MVGRSVKSYMMIYSLNLDPLARLSDFEVSIPLKISRADNYIKQQLDLGL